MMKMTSILCAAAMALSVPFAAPAVAMPAASPTTFQGQAMLPGQGAVQEVQYRQRGERQRVQPRRGERHRRGFERRGNTAYYNSHRGYRERRPGYRQHSGFWFPPAAFIAGAIIGNTLTQSQPPVRYRPRVDAHVEWCNNRYRSYRVSDNTFQPYHGPRRQCTSPYG